MPALSFSEPDTTFGKTPRISWRYTAHDEEGEYAVASATEVLDSVGFGINANIIPQDRLEEKTTIGTQCHWFISQFLKTSSIPTGMYFHHERTMIYWECFLDWYTKHREAHPDFRAIAVECPWIMTGESWGGIPPTGLAGTTDLIDWEDGGYGITDWKFRVPYFYDAYQTAIYAILAANNPSVPVSFLDVPKMRRRCVYFNDKGDDAIVKYYSDQWDFKVAESATVIWHAHQGNKRVRRTRKKGI